MATDVSPGATLIDSIQNALIAAAEIGGNRLLDFDEAALDACREMQGRCVAIDVTDLDFQLYCHPGGWGIRLSRNPPAGEVHATISGHLLALMNLAAQEDKMSTSIRERVRFHGDVALAQRLQKLVANLDIDWEEALARHTGDVLAVQIHRGARAFGEWLHDSADSLLHTSSEYLREEARLTPVQAEFDAFQSRVTELKYDVARAETRLQRLVEKLEAAHD
jgi:ubiquinone biosynthesis protein UbiJ